MVIENAMFAAIEIIDNKPYKKPYEKTYPVFSRQRKHKDEAGENTGKRHKRDKRSSEWTLSLRMFLSHNENSRTDDYKGKQGTDVDQFRKQS